MTPTIKLIVLAALLVSDVAAAAVVSLRLNRIGRPQLVPVVCGGIAISYLLVAGILWFAIE